MAITLNKKLIPAIVAKAHAAGLISDESSTMVAVYQISRHWRELFQTATRHRSDTLPGWNEKEAAAARIITAALLFLAMEQCRDVEQLITDTVNAELENLPPSVFGKYG